MKQIFESTGNFRRSLRFRLITASVIVEIVMLALMIGNNIRQSGEHLSGLTRSRMNEIAETVSISLAPALAARDYASLQSLVDRLVALPDLSYLEVRDRDSRIIASARQSSAVLVPSPDNDVQDAESDIEMYGQHYGSLRYGLSLAELRKAKHDLLIQGLVIALAEIFLTVAALSSIAILLTRRLENLTRASVRFAAGNYETVVGIRGNDEVAALSAAFNTMGSAVREQFQRLEENAVVLHRANGELSRLAEITAHHLQEPVRQMVSYSQMLQKASDPALTPETQHYLSYIINGAKRMKRLLVDLQAYVAVDINPTSGGRIVNLATCAENAWNKVHQRANDCAAEITLGPLPRVIGNAGQLTSVFLHLFDNALEHHDPQRPPRISVSVTHAEHSEIISIRDNGLGIDPAYFTRVFVLFERLDAGGTGTGIGLAMVNKIVESHGGHVWIESNSPHGTSVNFALPSLKEGTAK
ncbi:MAG: HAMP domain-containing protein [Magnetospirillum sp.]|nr:HAMP domain-containing protein [Magnetospirillum sp.]